MHVELLKGFFCHCISQCPWPLQFCQINLITNEAWTGHICYPGNVFPLVFNFVANLFLLKWALSLFPSEFYLVYVGYFIWCYEIAIWFCQNYPYASYNTIILVFLLRISFLARVCVPTIEFLNFSMDLLLLISYLLFYMRLCKDS